MSQPNTISVEHVWNPTTSRLIKKHGRVHKRLQRDHPKLLDHASNVHASLRSTPRTDMHRCTSDPTSSTTPTSIAQTAAQVPMPTQETPQKATQAKAKQRKEKKVDHLLESWFDMDPNSKATDTKHQADKPGSGHPFDHMFDDLQDNNQRVNHTVNTSLDNHGPEMLADDKDPNTDFLDFIFRKLNLS